MVLSKGAGGTDVCMAIASKLACLDLQAAEATSDDDKQLIFELIERSGGFASMNACVRESIRHALLKVYSRFERDFSKFGGCLKHKWHFHFKQWASPARYFLCLILRSGRWTKALQKPHLPPKAWDVDSCVRTRHSFSFPAFCSWS